MVNFTNCDLVRGRAYNGANGNKIAVRYNGEIYMIKFPPAAKDKPTELSYTNSCISEHIASSIFNMIGVRAHDTQLGYYDVLDKTKVVCACKDFAVEGKKLLDFCSIKNSVLESDSNGTGTELTEVLDAIASQQYVDASQLLKHFWSVFIVDALLGNFDRHNGNWGFLYNDAKDESEIAPVYDCGSCLLPQADDKIMQKVLNNESELQARIFVFPNSALKLNGNKINYYNFLMAGDNEDCNNALLEIFPRIKINDILRFIDSIEILSHLQKEFYKTYLGSRYELLLKPAYELIKNRTKGMSLF